jgi:signal transduction histidine kinase
MYTFPEISDHPNTWEYFWYMLPYAVPSFLTFVIGIVLGIMGLFRLRKRENMYYYVSFSMMVIGFGSLGLVLALRSVLFEEGEILFWNNILYPFVMLLSPGAYLFIYYVLEKKYKSLLYYSFLAWATVFWGMIGILQGRGFTGDFLYYSFGKYPVSSIYLRPWGIIGALGFFLLYIPAQIHYFKNHSLSSRKYALLGADILLVLIISNLPSFIGISFFPGSTFAFIPMLILAYGVFSSDFKDIKDLLFEKNGLFFLLNTILGFILLGIAFGILSGITIYRVEQLDWGIYQILPFLSSFVILGLGIFLGGTNPRSPLNQLGSLSLFIHAAQIMGTCINAFRLDPIVGLRLQQFFYIFFCITVSIQVRFVLISLSKSYPWFLKWIDLFSFLLSSLAFSPFLFQGYYEYSWGRYSASGPVIKVLAFIGISFLFYLVREWWKSSRESRRTKLGDWIAIYAVLSWFLILGNIFPTNGIPLYPPGNFSFLTAFLLVYAVIRYGEEAVRTEAFRISSRLFPFGLIGTMILLSFIWTFLPVEISSSIKFLYLCFLGAPLLLLAFLVSFVLIRPIAYRIDNMLFALEEKKKQAESAKQEIEDIIAFTYIINSTANLNNAFVEISKYMYAKFRIKTVWLLLLDESSKELYSYKVYSYDKLDENLYDFIKNKKFTFEKENQNFKKILDRGKPFYIPNIRHSDSILEVSTLEILKLKSVLLVPLISNNQTIGVLLFSNISDQLNLSRKEVRKISTLCAQISGTIETVHLLEQIEKAKKETEKLAESRKRLSMVGQMVAGIVHDIKNPIASIKGLAERLNSPKITQEKKERNTKMIVKEMDRLNDMVYEILDFSKGNINLQVSEVKLSDYISEILDFLKADLEYNSIRAIGEIHFDGNVELDISRIRRVIVNLVQNSIEVMQDGKKDYFVKIYTKEENEFYTIAVEDNGPGLPASMEEKIFQAFATEGKEKGTGLGLFMSKMIVEAHGGSLSYQTQRGEGTTFFINLPKKIQKQERENEEDIDRG